MSVPMQGETAACSKSSRTENSTESDTPRGLFGEAVRLQFGALVILVCLICQWALFVQFFGREVARAYPAAYDQSVYLSQAYETYDRILREGLWSGLQHGALMRLPQGKMMHLQGALALLLAGPGRLSALSLNFLYFALLECIAAYTILWATKRWSIVFLGVGLLLTTHSRFLLAGGMADFRLDHITCCLFGIFICVTVRSRVFRSLPWSIAAGFTGGMLLLFRFQTALTMAASLAVMLSILTVTAFRTRDMPTRDVAFARIRGLLGAGAVITCIVAPALWLARQELRAYYVGQAVSGPKIRAAELGATGPFTYWTFYLQSLVSDHLGRICCLLAVLLLLVLFFAVRLRPPLWDDERDDGHPAFPAVSTFLGIMLFVPLAILTAYPVRNPIVANILITPALGLLIGIAAAYAGTPKSGVLPRPSATLCVLAGLTFSCGLGKELQMAPRRTYLSTEPESVLNVVQLYDEIANRSRQMGWSSPRISFDRVQDYLFPAHLSALAYERHGLALTPESVLGNDIQPVSTDAAVRAISSSDFAVVTDPSSPEGPGFAFPFNVSMARIQGQLHEVAERCLVPIGHFQAFRSRFTLYMRPSVRAAGDSGGWITSEGLTLAASAETLRARPNIQLAGATILAEQLGNISMNARLIVAGRTPIELPVEFHLPIAPRSTIQYNANIHVDAAKLPAAGDVQIKISFDKFFVPKVIGFNEDTRQLVLMAPKQITLSR